jgi:hypothetical protein
LPYINNRDTNEAVVNIHRNRQAASKFYNKRKRTGNQQFAPGDELMLRAVNRSTFAPKGILVTVVADVSNEVLRIKYPNGRIDTVNKSRVSKVGTRINDSSIGQHLPLPKSSKSIIQGQRESGVPIATANRAAHVTFSPDLDDYDPDDSFVDAEHVDALPSADDSFATVAAEHVDVPAEHVDVPAEHVDMPAEHVDMPAEHVDVPADDSFATMPANEHVDVATDITPRRRWRAPHDDDARSTSATHDNYHSPSYMRLRQNPVPNSRFHDFELD